MISYSQASCPEKSNAFTHTEFAELNLPSHRIQKIELFEKNNF